jgi:hypothetical protein
MKTCCLALGGLLLAVLPLCAADADKEKKDEGPTCKTPQAVFEAASAAMKKGDEKAVIGCFSPEGQKKMAAALAFGALHQQAAAQEEKEGKKYREQFKLILAALDKHGLGTDVTNKLQPRLIKPEEQAKVLRELEDLVKDPAGLYVDLKAAYARTEGFNRKPNAPPGEPKLTDVKIDGDKATGTVVFEVDDREVKRPVEFVKIGGSWKLAPPAKPGAKAR